MIKRLATALATLLLATPAFAAGDLATKAIKLPELKLGAPDNSYAVSQKDYELETGKAYRLPITSAGDKEMAFESPDFFRNIWIREIKVGDLEVHTSIAYHVEFDGPGTMDIYFVPVRTGSFAWEIEGLAEQGMKGTITVK